MASRNGPGLEGIRSYRDLRVWQEAMDLAEGCYRLTRSFPREEIYGLTSQIRRSAASIPANIAEGYGRGTRKEYLQFLRIARGSLKELETHLLLAARVELVSEGANDDLLAQSERLGRRLVTLFRALQQP